MAKRHLPLVQGGKPEETDPPRAPWQWVGFGALAIVVVWLPLSAIAGALAKRLLDGQGDEVALRGAAFLAVLLYAFALSLGALAGGYLVGRWAPAGVGVRHAVTAGLAAAVLLGGATTVVTGGASGQAAGALLLAAMAPGMAGLGGWFGLRGRRTGSW